MPRDFLAGDHCPYTRCDGKLHYPPFQLEPYLLCDKYNRPLLRSHYFRRTP